MNAVLITYAKKPPLNVHSDIPSKAIGLPSGLSLPLYPYFASARNEGSSEAQEPSLLADMSTKLSCAGPYDPAHVKMVANAYV